MKKLLSLFFLTTLFITPSYSAQSGQSLMGTSLNAHYYNEYNSFYAPNTQPFFHQELPVATHIPFQPEYGAYAAPQPFYFDPHTGLYLVPTTYARPYPVQTIPLQDALPLNVPTDTIQDQKNDHLFLVLKEAFSGKKQALFDVEKKTKGLGGMSLAEILKNDSHAFLVCAPSKIKEDFIFSQPQFMDIRPERFNSSEIETPQIYEFINDKGTVKSRCITQIIINFLKLETADPRHIIDFAKRLELNSPSDEQIQAWHKEINGNQEKKIESPQKNSPIVLPVAPKELTEKEIASKELAAMKQQIEKMALTLTLQTQELEQLKKKEFAEKAEQEKLQKEKKAVAQQKQQNKKAAAQQQKKAAQHLLESKAEQEKQLKIIQQQEAEACIKQKEEQAKAEAHRQKEEARIQKIKALQEARAVQEAQEKAAREEQEKIEKMNQRQIVIQENLAHKNEKAKVKALIDQKINADNLAKRMQEKTLKEEETRAPQSKKTKKSASQSASFCSKDQKITKGKQDEEALFLAQEAARVKKEKDTLLGKSIKEFNIADTNRLKALTEKNYGLSLHYSLDKLNTLIRIKTELPQEKSLSINNTTKTLIELTQGLIDEVTKDLANNPDLKETAQYKLFITKLTEIVSKKNILFEVSKEGQKHLITSIPQKRSTRLALEEQVKLLNQSTQSSDAPKEEPNQITLNSYGTAISLFEQGKIKDALSHFEHAEKLGHPSAFLNSAACLRLLGEIDQSLEILKKAFQTMDYSPEEIRAKIPGQLALTLWKKPDTLHTEILKLLHQGQSLKDVDCYFFEALLLREGNHPDWPQEKMCTLGEPHHTVECSCKAIFNILHNNQENPKEEELSERALREIGSMYEIGEGIKKNPQKAVKYYRLSLAKGSKSAAAYLGRCLCEGIGCTKDIDTGIKYLVTAVNKSSIIAKRFLLHEIIKNPHQNPEKKDLEYFSFLFLCLNDIEENLDQKEIQDTACTAFHLLCDAIETIKELGAESNDTLRPTIVYGYNKLLAFVKKHQDTFKSTLPTFESDLTKITIESEKTTVMYINKLPKPEYSDQVILLAESCQGTTISDSYNLATQQVYSAAQTPTALPCDFAEYKETLFLQAPYNEESRDTVIVPLCHEILKNTEIYISIKPKPEIIKDLTTKTQSIIKLYKNNFSLELAEILFSINNNLIKSIERNHDIFAFNDILKYQTILAIGQSEITNYLINTSDRFDEKTESCYKQTKGYIDKFFTQTLLELNNQSISEKKAFEQTIELVSQGSVYWGENFNHLFKILPLIQKLKEETQTECPYFYEKKRVLERAYYLIKKEVPAEIERLKNTSLQEDNNQFSLYKQALTLQKSCDIIPGLEQYKEEIFKECATLKKSLERFNRDVYAQTQKLKKTAQVLSHISHILKPHEISCYLPGASAPLEEDIFKKLKNTSTTTKPIYATLLNEIVKLHTNPTEANISLLVKNKKNLFKIYTLGIAHQRNKESINTIHGLCLAIPYLNAEEQSTAQARMHQIIETITHDLLREISISSGDAQEVYKDVFQHLLITFHTEPDYKQTILKVLESESNTSDFLK